MAMAAQVFVELKKDGDVMEEIMRQLILVLLTAEMEEFKDRKYVMMKMLKLVTDAMLIAQKLNLDGLVVENLLSVIDFLFLSSIRQ